MCEVRKTDNRNFHASWAGHLVGGDVPRPRLEPRLYRPVGFCCSVVQRTESIQKTPWAPQGARSGNRGTRWFGHLCVLVCISRYEVYEVYPTLVQSADRCVRASLPEVSLSPQMYVLSGRQQPRVASGACARSEKPKTGTFMHPGPVT